MKTYPVWRFHPAKEAGIARDAEHEAAAYPEVEGWSDWPGVQGQPAASRQQPAASEAAEFEAETEAEPEAAEPTKSRRGKKQPKE